MATITPTLSLTSNASTASTPGPLSVALSLSATKATTVNGNVTSKVCGVTTTHTDNLIFDASTTNEAYIYINNTSDEIIYVCNDDAETAANRFMALRAGEFAWFPWFAASAGTATDIYLDHSGGGTKNVEYWIFEVA